VHFDLTCKESVQSLRSGKNESCARLLARNVKRGLWRRFDGISGSAQLLEPNGIESASLPAEPQRVNGAHFCIATLRATVTTESLMEFLLARHGRIRPSMALDQTPQAACEPLPPNPMPTRHSIRSVPPARHSEYDPQLNSWPCSN